MKTEIEQLRDLVNQNSSRFVHESDQYKIVAKMFEVVLRQLERIESKINGEHTHHQKETQKDTVKESPPVLKGDDGLLELLKAWSKE